MMRNLFSSRPLLSLAAVAIVAVGAVVVLKLVPTSAESRTSPAAAYPDGIISPATATKPAMIVPSQHAFPVVRTKAQWKARLSPNQFFILRQKGTEPPFSGRYYNNHQAGIYYSAATGQPLFSSKDKFDSGTGWPSFTKPIVADAVRTKTDRSLWMTRTEARSAGADSHLGHVFDDGPADDGGQRHCMNSAALRLGPHGRPFGVRGADGGGRAPRRLARRLPGGPGLRVPRAGGRPAGRGQASSSRRRVRKARSAGLVASASARS